MLNSLITSKTRTRLLLKFFLNSRNKSYLRNLEQEFGESSNSIRVELNRLEKAGLLVSETQSNRKYFSANTGHPLFNEIHNILIKTIGIDQLIERVIGQIGDLEAAYITGDFARGIDSQIIDLVLVGQSLDHDFINQLVHRAEALVERKVRHLVLTADEMDDYFKGKPALLIWKVDEA